jgi:hypothetical protein
LNFFYVDFNCFVLEVEDSLPSDNDEILGIPKSCLFPKCEDVPFGNFPGFSGPCKLQPDTQEYGATSFDSQGISEIYFFLFESNISYNWL